MCAYAGNDPINFNDPTGRDEEQCNELHQSRRLGGPERFRLIEEERGRYLEAFGDVETREVLPEVSWLDRLHAELAIWVAGGPEGLARIAREAVTRGGNTGGPRG